MGKKLTYGLSIVGGILNILCSLFFGLLFIFLLIGITAFSSILQQNQDLFGKGVSMFFVFCFLFVLYLGLGIMGIYFSRKEKKEEKSEIFKGGVGCLICGVFTINIFLIVGGVLGILEGKRVGESDSSSVVQIQASPVVQQ